MFVEERSEEEMYSARGVDASLDCGYDFLSVHEMMMMMFEDRLNMIDSQYVYYNLPLMLPPTSFRHSSCIAAWIQSQS